MFQRARLARGADGGGCEEGVVHGAGAVAFGVESDVEEAERFDSGGDGFEDGQRESARKVVAGYFDARQVAVVANTDLRKTESVKGFFSLLDLREIIACDGAAVLDA